MKKGESNKKVPTTMQSLDAQEQANQTFAINSCYSIRL